MSSVSEGRLSVIDVLKSTVGYAGMCGGAVIGGIVVRQGLVTLTGLNMNASSAEDIMRKAVGEIADGVVTMGAGFRAGRLISPDTPKPGTLLIALFILGLAVPPATGKK
jgi:hypothetical protein